MNTIETDGQHVIVATSLDGFISFDFFDDRDDQLVEGVLTNDWYSFIFYVSASLYCLNEDFNGNNRASYAVMVQDHFLMSGRDSIVEFNLNEGDVTRKYEGFIRKENSLPRIIVAGGPNFASNVGDSILFWRAGISEVINHSIQ